MSPAKLRDHESKMKRDINGARPSPLKVHKESHLIQKYSSSYGPQNSSTSNNSSSPSSSSYLGLSAGTVVENNKTEIKQPVIIYTQSPKIIHAKASDFMALVQKLTGYSPFDLEESTEPSQPKTLDVEEQSRPLVRIDGGDRWSDRDLRLSPKIINSRGSDLANSYLRNIPLFTPNSMNLFYSPHRRPYASRDAGNSMSPSVVEFVRHLPEF